MCLFSWKVQFPPERKETWSLGATESEVWIGNLNVKVRKTTEHILHIMRMGAIGSLYVKAWKTTKFKLKKTSSWFRIGPSGVLLLLKFSHFSPERAETGSLDTTESEVWIGSFYVKAWETTEHKLHKIWRLLKFCTNSAKRAHPRRTINILQCACILRLIAV